METNLQSFTDYCKEFIKDHIDGYVGGSYYGCDLGYKITEGINADGSCTYNAREARQYLSEWWEDAANYWDYEKFSFGEHLTNPFDRPEAYMVCMVIEGCNQLLSGYFNEHDELWNLCFELTQDIADDICTYLDEDASDIEF